MAVKLKIVVQGIKAVNRGRQTTEFQGNVLPSTRTQQHLHFPNTDVVGLLKLERQDTF
jgi:hypothetical protein